MARLHPFHPVDQPDFPTLVGFAPAMLEPIPKPEGVFACRKCHRVQNFSRLHLGHDWNTLILRCTGGLLYGSEVKMPEWLKPQRKNVYPTRRHAPNPLRDRIQRFMVETDLRHREIAERMGLKTPAVSRQACAILRQHHVHGRAELRAMLRQKQTPAMAKAG